MEVNGQVTSIARSNSIGKVLDVGTHVIDANPGTDEPLHSGEYAIIRSLIRVLEGGIECKRQVDKVIDECASMQNLREAISTYGNSILRQRDEMKRAAALSFFVEYLERYYFLICFAVYIRTERSALHSNGCNQDTFTDWMRARPELYSILRRLLRRDPMGALGYATAKSCLKKIAPSVDEHLHDVGMVAAMRKGEVLGRQTVLKSDHCPGCQNLTLPEIIEGAPNFREIPGFPVYGVANPTIDGIRAVMQRISSKKGNCPILWHNMREEPVIYINGKPFVLREVERPYKNMLEYTGIDRERVERMEARLKEDILREAQIYGGTIMVVHETDDHQIFDSWERVNSNVVQTPVEVYKSLEAEGLPIKYARVPITDGKAPKSSDFDTVAINVACASKDAAFVFNCQMGQGRTTTGTVIACLVKLRMDYGRPIRRPSEGVSREEIDSGSSSCEEEGPEKVLDTSEIMKIKKDKRHYNFGIDDVLLLGKITALFDNGIKCREVLDAVINRCSAMQNIRQAVMQYRKVFNQQNVEPRVRRVALNRAAEYLERYFRLIAFSAYIGSEMFDGFCEQGKSRITFKTWVHRMPEVQAMKWSIRLRPGRFLNIPVEFRTPHDTHHGDSVMEAIVNARNGSVLGKGTILKMCFPGQRNSNNIQLPGALHVFKVDGYSVYSLDTPTISGEKELLKLLNAKSTGPGSTARKVILTDLREEAVAYINGAPFVLRELNQSVDTLKHVGITGPVVEHMESRVKEDILDEVTQSGGRMLLHREEFDPTTKHPNVIGYWENVLLDDVKTPAEVHASLRDEGYNVVYKRIPLTREREALAADVDAIQLCAEGTADCFLFVSHTGFGGVSYAMAITSLKLHVDELSRSEKPEYMNRTNQFMVHGEPLPANSCDEDLFRQGEYRDILSLTRVLVYGPQSKAEVDAIIDRCAGAGNLREEILYYRKELLKGSHVDDENKSYLVDMGIKALRRYFFLIAFRSYLFTTMNTSETRFTAWMDARPELGHLCNNLRLDM